MIWSMLPNLINGPYHLYGIIKRSRPVCLMKLNPGGRRYWLVLLLWCAAMGVSAPFAAKLFPSTTQNFDPPGGTKVGGKVGRDCGTGV